MMKVITISLACAGLLALQLNATAQSSAKDDAVSRAILNQQSTILLHQKLAEAKAALQRNDTVAAAKSYQEAFAYCKEIGSGIDPEIAQTKAGLAATRIALARVAQSRGDYREADTQLKQILNADPKNVQAVALKKQNDQMLDALKGRIPSPQTLAQIPEIMKQKTDAGTLVQDGKLLYEAGKLEEAEYKLNEALKLDPDNSAAYTYQNLIKQSKLLRESALHSVDTQDRMAKVEKQWVSSKSTATLPPFGNPYATNTLVYTGPGRQMILEKLNRIRLESVNYDGVPLSEVLKQLSEKSRLADLDRKGINFLINPNPDQSGAAIASPTGGGLGGLGGLGGFPGGGPPAAVDPATGLPAAPGGPGGGGGNSAEALDAGAFTVKLSLVDVRLTDVLQAIMEVAQNPNPGDQRTIKYTIKDYGIVFQAKGAEQVQMFIREFKVDPNTFYSGLESVGANQFGGSGQQSGGGGGGGSRGGGGGGGGGGGSQSGGGAVVGVVNPFAGGGQLRNQSGGGGGQQGGGQQGGGARAGGQQGAATGGGGGQTEGLPYVTGKTFASEVSVNARAYFSALGVNLDQPAGKAVFFNDKSGKLLVRATEQDLDTIEQAIHALNEVAPQVHIKTRFIEVQQKDNKALGFDWYLGDFIHGDLIGTGGSQPSKLVPASIANPQTANTPPGFGQFPGEGSSVPISGNDQLLTQGLRNSGPALATLTGILTDPNFRVVLHALEQRGGFESLGEPEVTTTSGRQTQMRATQIINVVTGFSFDNGTGGGNASQGTVGGTTGGTTVNQAGTSSVSPSTQPVETGPILDVVPYVLSDGYTINMALIPSLTDFNGYDTISAGEIPGYNPGTTLSGAGPNGGTTLPVALPKFTVRQVVTTVNVWDNQTVALGGLITSTVQNTKDKVPMLGDIPMLGRLFQSQSKSTIKNNLMIFVTATIVDPAGNRVHSDEDLPFAITSTPEQAPGYGTVKEAGSQKVSAESLKP